MSFEEVIGQRKAKDILRDELKSQRIKHAYLFTGKDGLGKKKLALEFVRALFCENKQFDNCGQCISCKKIEHQNHADVRLLSLDEGSSKFSISQVRELQQEIVYKPYESSRKVYIIEDADKMSLEAANSLLRTLEEPPDYAVIILLAEEINQLLPTIISRCQQVFFYDVNTDKIESYLKEKGATKKQAHLFSNLAAGSPRRALEFMQDEQFIENRDMVFSFLKNITEKKRYQILQKAEEVEQIYQKGFPVFDLISSWYRDIMLCIEGNNEQIVNIDFLSDIKEQSQQYNLVQLVSIIERVDEMATYLQKNVNRRLILDVLLIGIRSGRM